MSLDIAIRRALALEPRACRRAIVSERGSYAHSQGGRWTSDAATYRLAG
jgi:hypothetical protein